MKVTPNTVSGAGGEDSYLSLLKAVLLDAECNLGSPAFADPVGLHRVYAVGPVDAAEVEEFVGVLGDPEEPLLQVPPGHRGATTLARAVWQDLLVGEGGLAGRAPIGRGLVPYKRVLRGTA